MIQRIQSLFLALSSGSFLSLFGLPIFTTETATGAVYENMTMDLQDHMGLLICSILGGVISLISIFLFKNRKMQLSLCYVAVLAGFGLMISAIYLHSMTGSLGAYGVGSIMPLLAVLFSFLAIRFIKKDDKLVKSMDRLR